MSCFDCYWNLPNKLIDDDRRVCCNEDSAKFLKLYSEEESKGITCELYLSAEEHGSCDKINRICSHCGMKLQRKPIVSSTDGSYICQKCGTIEMLNNALKLSETKGEIIPYKFGKKSKQWGETRYIRVYDKISNEKIAEFLSDEAARYITEDIFYLQRDEVYRYDLDKCYFKSFEVPSNANKYVVVMHLDEDENSKYTVQNILAVCKYDAILKAKNFIIGRDFYGREDNQDLGKVRDSLVIDFVGMY